MHLYKNNALEWVDKILRLRFFPDEWRKSGGQNVRYFAQVEEQQQRLGFAPYLVNQGNFVYDLFHINEIFNSMKSTTFQKNLIELQQEVHLLIQRNEHIFLFSLYALTILFITIQRWAHYLSEAMTCWQGGQGTMVSPCEDF